MVLTFAAKRRKERLAAEEALRRQREEEARQREEELARQRAEEARQRAEEAARLEVLRRQELERAGSRRSSEDLGGDVSSIHLVDSLEDGVSSIHDVSSIQDVSSIHVQQIPGGDSGCTTAPAPAPIEQAPPPAGGGELVAGPPPTARPPALPLPPPGRPPAQTRAPPQQEPPAPLTGGVRVPLPLLQEPTPGAGAPEDRQQSPSTRRRGAGSGLGLVKNRLGKVRAGAGRLLARSKFGDGVLTKERQQRLLSDHPARSTAQPEKNFLRLRQNLDMGLEEDDPCRDQLLSEKGRRFLSALRVQARASKLLRLLAGAFYRFCRSSFDQLSSPQLITKYDEFLFLLLSDTHPTPNSTHHRSIVHSLMAAKLLQTKHANVEFDRASTELTTTYNSPAHFLFERCFPTELPGSGFSHQLDLAEFLEQLDRKAAVLLKQPTKQEPSNSVLRSELGLRTLAKKLAERDNTREDRNSRGEEGAEEDSFFASAGASAGASGEHQKTGLAAAAALLAAKLAESKKTTARGTTSPAEAEGGVTASAVAGPAAREGAGAGEKTVAGGAPSSGGGRAGGTGAPYLLQRDRLVREWAHRITAARAERKSDQGETGLRRRLLKRYYFSVASLLPDRGWERRLEPRMRGHVLDAVRDAEEQAAAAAGDDVLRASPFGGAMYLRNRITGETFWTHQPELSGWTRAVVHQHTAIFHMTQGQDRGRWFVI